MRIPTGMGFRVPVQVRQALRKPNGYLHKHRHGKRPPIQRDFTDLIEILNGILNDWGKLVHLRKRVRQHHPRMAKAFNGRMKMLNEQAERTIGQLERFKESE